MSEDHSRLAVKNMRLLGEMSYGAKHENVQSLDSHIEGMERTRFVKESTFLTGEAADIDSL